MKVRRKKAAAAVEEEEEAVVVEVVVEEVAAKTMETMKHNDDATILTLFVKTFSSGFKFNCTHMCTPHKKMLKTQVSI